MSQREKRQRMSQREKRQREKRGRMLIRGQRDGKGTYGAGFSTSPSIERLYPSPALLGHALGGVCGRTSALQPNDIFLGRGGLDSGGVAYMLLGGMVSEDRVDLLRNLRAQISSTHPPSRLEAQCQGCWGALLDIAGEYSSALSS